MRTSVATVNLAIDERWSPSRLFGSKRWALPSPVPPAESEHGSGEEQFVDQRDQEQWKRIGFPAGHALAPEESQRQTLGWFDPYLSGKAPAPKQLGIGR
jgi:hypothetical protein